MKSAGPRSRIGRGGSFGDQLTGLGASAGLLAGFAVLFAMAHAGRRRWLEGR